MVPSWYKRIVDVGMTGPDVDIVRRKLGLGPGPYDSTTERMVASLARSKKIASNGEVNKEVAEHLGPSAAEAAGLGPGWYTRPIEQMFQEGEDVRALRERLGLGDYDNRFDADAEAAVRRIQSANDLPVTGLVDEATARIIG
jgi:murein L,D-transpeptidase YcbB/YkuD